MLIAVDVDYALPKIGKSLQLLNDDRDGYSVDEYIIEQLRDKKAFLFMDTSGSDSFVVLSTNTCARRKVRTLFVLAAYCKEGEADKLYGEEIDQLAREAKCTEVEFISSRRGWERAAKKYGYEPVEVTYRKKLNG